MRKFTITFDGITLEEVTSKRLADMLAEVAFEDNDNPPLVLTSRSKSYKKAVQDIKRILNNQWNKNHEKYFDYEEGYCEQDIYTLNEVFDKMVDEHQFIFCM